MVWVQKVKGGYEEIDPSAMIVEQRNGMPTARHPPYIVNVWSAAELEAIGVFEAAPFEVPAGQRIVGVPRYAKRNGQVRQIYDTEPEEQVLPEEITKARLLTVLATDGWISAQEAIDAARLGVMPAKMAEFVDRLSEHDAFHVKIAWAAETAFRRTDTITSVLMSSYGLSGDQIDDLFRKAASL